MSSFVQSRSRLNTLVKIRGHLFFETAFHLGGGRFAFSTTDSPVVRDADGRPFIPGSSIKGAMRAAVERIVPNLDLTACGLFDHSVHCLTPQDENEEHLKAYRKVLESLHQEIASVRGEINTVLSWSGKTADDLKGSVVTEDTFLFLLDNALCHVCKAFGSPFLGAAIFFHDAHVVKDLWLGMTQIRDGVGIDRDSGRAVEGVKYDFEVVPPQTAFDFSMTIESDYPIVLGLAALGLHELVEGNVPLGGIKSRGLGRCRLAKETKAEKVGFNDRKQLLAYLQNGIMQEQDVPKFIQDNIKHILPKETAHV